jgi:hypothetical protein
MLGAILSLVFIGGMLGAGYGVDVIAKRRGARF